MVTGVHLCAIPTCETLVCCFVECALLSIRLMVEKIKAASYCSLSFSLSHKRSHAHRFPGSVPEQCMCGNGCLSSPHALTALRGQRSHKQLSQKGFLFSFVLIITTICLVFTALLIHVHYLCVSV